MAEQEPTRLERYLLKAAQKERPTYCNIRYLQRRLTAPVQAEMNAHLAQGLISVRMVNEHAIIRLTHKGATHYRTHAHA